MKTEVLADFDDADEMIRANGEAEAREADRLRVENERYRREAAERNASGKQILDAIDRAESSLSAQLKDSDDAAYHNGVRVYRNVQAAMISELDKQTKDIGASLYALQQTQLNMDAALRDIQEESMKQEPKREKPSALTIITFLLVLLLLAFEICDKLGLVDRLLTLL